MSGIGITISTLFLALFTQALAIFVLAYRLDRSWMWGVSAIILIAFGWWYTLNAHLVFPNRLNRTSDGLGAFSAYLGQALIVLFLALTSKRN